MESPTRLWRMCIIAGPGLPGYYFKFELIYGFTKGTTLISLMKICPVYADWPGFIKNFRVFIIEPFTLCLLGKIWE